MIPQIFTAMLLCLLLTACSTSKPSQPQTKMISDVSELVDMAVYTGGSVGTYRYQHVIIEGDMLLSEYTAAVNQAAAFFIATETVVRVKNYRAFPASVTGSLNLPAVTLMTCATANYEDCAGGKVYEGNVTDGVLTVTETGLYWVP